MQTSKTRSAILPAAFNLSMLQRNTIPPPCRLPSLAGAFRLSDFIPSPFGGDIPRRPDGNVPPAAIFRLPSGSAAIRSMSACRALSPDSNSGNSESITGNHQYHESKICEHNDSNDIQ
jgi:hypothetical protein